MRVTCDGCGAKYAIADERLQGRSVRVKCKKCGASIAVGAAGALGAAGGGAAAEPAWTVLLDDGEQRPVTAEQLAELFREGAVHADTYLWKEGMDDWLPFGEVEEAKRMAAAPLEQGVEVTAVPIAETPAAGPAVERARRAIVSSPNVDLFGEAGPASKGASPSPGRVEAGPPRAGSPLSSRGGALRAGGEGSPLSARGGSPLSARSEAELSPVSSRSAPLAARASGAAPLSARSAGVDSTPFSSRAGAGALSPRPGGDLFGPPSSGPGSRRGGFDAPPSSQAPGSQNRAGRPDDRINATLSGSRNDDSVLFSVANLSGAPKNGAEPAKKLSFDDVPVASPSPGVITSDSEASGMIDMRILSTMHGGPPKKEAPREDRVDDLMNMGGGGAGGGLSGPLFGPTLSSPMLAPPSLEAAPLPPPPSAAEAMPASEGTARDAEAPLAVATASSPGPRRSKLPRWTPFAAAGVLGLGVLSVLGLSGLMSTGPEKTKVEPTAMVAKAPKADDASRRAQEPAAALGRPEADAPKADAPKADAPEAAPPAGEAAAAPKADEAKAEAEADAAGKAEGAVARGPKTPEQRRRDEEAAKRKREREEADRKEASDKQRAEQEKKAAADSRGKTEAASAAAAAAAAGPAGTGSFDRGAASAALSSAAGGVGGCKKADGPTGLGRVAVTFAPSGAVTNAVVEGPPFAGTPVGGCVAAKFRSAKVPAFAGSSITVKKSFSIN